MQLNLNLGDVIRTGLLIHTLGDIRTHIDGGNRNVGCRFIALKNPETKLEIIVKITTKEERRTMGHRHPPIIFPTVEHW